MFLSKVGTSNFGSLTGLVGSVVEESMGVVEERSCFRILRERSNITDAVVHRIQWCHHQKTRILGGEKTAPSSCLTNDLVVQTSVIFFI